MRLQMFVQELGVSYPLTDAQERIASMVQTKVATVARNSLAEIRQWQTSLQVIAGHLEALVWQAKRAVADDLDLPINELGGVPPMDAENEGGTD